MESAQFRVLLSAASLMVALALMVGLAARSLTPPTSTGMALVGIFASVGSIMIAVGLGLLVRAGRVMIQDERQELQSRRAQ